MYEDDEAHEAFIKEQEARGDLAFLPETLACYECTRNAGKDVMDDDACIQRKVIGLGGIAEAHRDPTQTYRLECGHTTI